MPTNVWHPPPPNWLVIRGREARQRHLAGESLEAIAADWVAAGIPPLFADGWNKHTLNRLIILCLNQEIGLSGTLSMGG